MQTYPKADVADDALIRQVESAKDVITKVRELRNQNQIKPREALSATVQDSESARALYTREGLLEMVVKLAVLSELDIRDVEPANSKSFISGTEKYYVVINQEIDVEAERAKIQQELEYQRGFLKSIEAKLSNERFVAGAPAAVVDNERKKQADALARIGILEESLARL